MKNIIKIMLGLLASFFLFALMFLVFMYFFTKPAKPIMEYEFPNMTYQELETRISDQNPKKLWDVVQLNDKKSKDSTAFLTRFVILGKDSLEYDFITYKDEDYKFKTKKRHSNNDYPWIELLGIRHSIGRDTGINYKNKKEHPEVIKLFEDEFIKKINNGKVNVIERGFWDWF